MENKYTKLSDLVGSDFTITKAWGYSFKRWDADAKRMLMEEKWSPEMKGENWRKVYSVETDKGKLDLGSGQLGNLLELAYDKGVSDIRQKTFKVSSNGKEGMDIRYYFKIDYNAEKKVDTVAEVDGEPMNLDDIPF